MAGRQELLFASVRAGQVAMMDALIAAEPELINATVDLLERRLPADEAGMTLLHVATAARQTEAVRRLIEHGVPVSARNGGGRMAVHDAFEYGQDEIAEMLIEAGSEIDAATAAAYGKLEILKALLPEQANDMTTGLTPLGWAAYGQQIEAARMLISAGAKVVGDPYDELAWGPAADVASIGVAKVLLGAGADPNWRDPAGNTPLHSVILSPLVAEPSFFVEALLEGGADRALKNAGGRTPLDEAKAQLQMQAYRPAQPGQGTKSLVRTVEVLNA
jgi:ankyrin repeat protein